MHRPPQLDLVSREEAAYLRTRSPQQTLAMAHGMWRLLRDRIRAAILEERPDVDQATLRIEVARRMSESR